MAENSIASRKLRLCWRPGFSLHDFIFAILGTFFRFSIEYRQFEGPDEHVPARRAVEKVLNQSGLSTAFSFVKVIN